jgi:hypothetical protein
MRLLSTILCVFLCVATMVTPFTHWHAHVDHDQHATEVHDGHQHDFEDAADDSADGAGHVVYLSNGISQLTGGDVPLLPWLVLLCMVAVLLRLEPLIRRIAGPVCRDILVPSQHPPWPPPPRGPPLSI